MYLIGWLPEGGDDEKVSLHATTYAVEATPLSAYRIEPANAGGLLLGYTGLNEEEIRAGVLQLARALRSCPSL